MSTERDEVRLMAERIARRVAQSAGAGEAEAVRAQSADGVGEQLAAMRSSLEELQKRLVQIESHVVRKDDVRAGQSVEQGSARQQPQSTSAVGVRSPWLGGMYVSATHPSQERFGVEEAAVSELVDFFEGEKKCELEPGGKPCDHCAMCNTRGF
ncbi:MAG TPA: hypothetical protein VF791_03155 [Pyrinomonadaceae bacterium]